MKSIGRLHNRRTSHQRRGNSIVLVAAILALLAIIATAYVSRTQTERITGRAVRQASQRDVAARSVAEDLSTLIGNHLFPRAVDLQYIDSLNSAWIGPDGVVSGNAPRFAPRTDRFGIDSGADGFGIFDHTYNFAPHAVVPWTNWPDDWVWQPPFPDGLNGNINNLPFGAGNPTGDPLAFPGDRNPLGNPGHGDTRWLADLEPMRFATTLNGNLNIHDTLTHWRHLSYIGTPENGYRIVTGIDDVFDSDGDGFGSLLLNLDVPVEQWLAQQPLLDLAGNPFFKIGTGANDIVTNAGYGGDPVWIPDPNAVPTSLLLRMGNRFFDYGGSQMHLPYRQPPNLLKLSDLNGDGVTGQLGERPQDEFNLQTVRGQISRWLADADGDGFTDSFWWLVPGGADAEIRQVLAVRIVDNSGMLNVNVAGPFVPNEPADPTLPRERTLGLTPTDLALVGQNTGFGGGGGFLGNWNVGYFDTPLNDHRGWIPFPFAYGLTEVSYDNTAWFDGTGYPFLEQIGAVPYHNGFNDTLYTQAGRLHYWHSLGLRPLAPWDGLTPFGVEDELEFRMFHGQNNPWHASRLERAIQKDVFFEGPGNFTRANLAREETSEYLDQLSVRGLLYDHRHRLTTHNGARNEEMPPWLRWRWERPFINPPHSVNFDAQSRRKIDLREPDENLSVFLPGEFSFRNRLARSLVLALTDGPMETASAPGIEWASYYGRYTNAEVVNAATPGVIDNTNPIENTRRLAAGLAANMIERRDADDLVGVLDAVRLPMVGNAAECPEDGSIRMMGIEAQPFILEAFVGHVYKAAVVPATDGPLNEDDPYVNSGNYVIMKDGTADVPTDDPTTAVVVQLANPFDRSIDLSRYQLSIFGQIVSLQDPNSPGPVILPPGTEEYPRTATFYAIVPTLGGDALETQWLDFLDIELSDVVAGSIVRNITTLISTDPTFYESIDPDNETIILSRLGEDPNDPTLYVDVDRIDAPGADDADRFATKVSELDAFSAGVMSVPSPLPDSDGLTTEFPVAGYPWDLGPQGDGFSHWIEWARVTRAWSADVDADGSVEPTERNPRYVMGYNDLTTSAVDGQSGTNYVMSTGGQKYNFGAEPDVPGAEWFTVEYDAPVVGPLLRKPTFFDMNRGDFNTIPLMADKGWYGDSGLMDFPMQMLQKDDEFVQIGEVMNVWAFGHEMAFDATPGTTLYLSTRTTFSEFMTMPELVGEADGSGGPDVEARVNRLYPYPVVFSGDLLGQIVGAESIQSPPARQDPRHAMPALPAAIRVLDLFVCDGKGLLRDFNGDGNVDASDINNPQPGGDVVIWNTQYLSNANRFSGKMSSGMINLNTAPLEVLRTLPHWDRLIHQDPAFGPLNQNPRSGLGDAVVQYREHFNGLTTGQRGGPDYWNNPPAFPPPDGDVPTLSSRGISSPGEILAMHREGTLPLTIPGQPSFPSSTLTGEAFRTDFGARLPHGGVLSHMSTDVVGAYDGASGSITADLVAGDVEEQNLLYAGASNIATTRSDVFTVYFRLRSFKRNPTTGVWNALDSEQIVDDARYVMLVDRSEVERPTDKPRILFLERIAN